MRLLTLQMENGTLIDFNPLQITHFEQQLSNPNVTMLYLKGDTMPMLIGEPVLDVRERINAALERDMPDVSWHPEFAADLIYQLRRLALVIGASTLVFVVILLVVILRTHACR